MRRSVARQKQPASVLDDKYPVWT